MNKIALERREYWIRKAVHGRVQCFKSLDDQIPVQCYMILNLFFQFSSCVFENLYHSYNLHFLFLILSDGFSKKQFGTTR